MTMLATGGAAARRRRRLPIWRPLLLLLAFGLLLYGLVVAGAPLGMLAFFGVAGALLLVALGTLGRGADGDGEDGASGTGAEES